MANRINVVVVVTHIDGLFQALPGDVDQLLGLVADVAHEERLVEVAVVSSVVHRDVDCRQQKKIEG